MFQELEASYPRPNSSSTASAAGITLVSFGIPRNVKHVLQAGKDRELQEYLTNKQARMRDLNALQRRGRGSSRGHCAQGHSSVKLVIPQLVAWIPAQIFQEVFASKPSAAFFVQPLRLGVPMCATQPLVRLTLDGNTEEV